MPLRDGVSLKAFFHDYQRHIANDRLIITKQFFVHI